MLCIRVATSARCFRVRVPSVRRQCSYIPRLASYSCRSSKIPSVRRSRIATVTDRDTSRARIRAYVTKQCTDLRNDEMTFDPLEAVVQVGNGALAGNGGWADRQSYLCEQWTIRQTTWRARLYICSTPVIVSACSSSVSCVDPREAVIRVAGTEKQCRGSRQLLFKRIEFAPFSSVSWRKRIHRIDSLVGRVIRATVVDRCLCVYVLYSADTGGASIVSSRRWVRDNNFAYIFLPGRGLGAGNSKVNWQKRPIFGTDALIRGEARRQEHFGIDRSPRGSL